MNTRLSQAVLGGLAIIAFGAAAPAAAQDNTDLRVQKLEAEVRALQRQVFPGAAGKFFQPEISTSTTAAPAASTASTSTTAVTDILVRLDALEGQLRSLTAQTEENTNSLRQLTARVTSLEAASKPAAATMPQGDQSAESSNLAAMTGGASQPAATQPSKKPTPVAPQGPTAARLAAVQEITKPQTDDPGDDEYVYGYRLWDAKFYPEAEQQLTLFVEKYPNHSRISYGRNLLGRAYMDDGKPKEAAPWFLRNYQTDKQGARAPDSLLYLGESMIALKDTKRACIALAEFGATYPAIASGRLADQYQSDLRKVKCN